MTKSVLITGASGGIGAAVAIQLAREGYHLYLHYHQNEKGINELLLALKEYPVEYYSIQADLSSEEGCAKLASSIFNLDAIVHCSGNSHYGLLQDLKRQDLEDLVSLHVTAPLMLTKILLPKMLSKKSGSIIVISSIWGQTGAAYEVAYSTVKGAQIAFVKALGKELASSGIRVNAIAPGAIQTAMMEGFEEEDIALLKEEIPLQRLGLPSEVADSVSFLLSNKSSYMTGQVLALNGGWYI